VKALCPEVNVSLVSPAVYLFVRNLLAREEGQDLVEYALVVALISFGAITGMGAIATSVNDVFCGLATTMTSSV
jgi:pilus assembly protein Flp/PilA